MTSQSYRFQFDPSVQFSDVRESLALALLTCESLHGAAKLSLLAEYHVDETRGFVEIGLSSRVGAHLALVFLHLARTEFGNESFTLSRICVDQAATVSGGAG